ncbi:MAG: signal peptide peptidase SppA [Treponema sp.]|jgi:protease-4|nr:signal peptide peptidase SppA [Treponema sp.]
MNLNGKLLFLGVCLLMARPLFSQEMFVELNLNNQAVQNMMRSVRPKPALEVFRVIERAGNDRRVSGIILNISAYQAGPETLWELRNALEKFKSKGKKVCAFISNADLDLYCLATVADKIVMDDQGALMMLGYAWGRGYLLHTLEKLGIGARELRYLEYKSAAESYTRDSLSDADRRQYGAILDDIMNLTRSTVTKARSWTDGEFDGFIDNDFFFSARSALERGIVDYTGRKETVLNVVKEISGNPKIETIALYGDTASSLSGSKYLYNPGRASRLSRPPLIAVIYANGVSDMERGIAARSLARTIEEMSKRRRVKALVIRINSPGGSAEAADYVAEAIKDARERIPVVVSMGGVAASGGYWASMTASHIVATPVTLTGSIGVIGSWFYDNGLNNKLGLTVDLMQRGAHADLTSGVLLPHRDLTPQEEARYQRYMLDLYSDFTAKVAAGRGMDPARVESLAQGRVFSGIGAFEAGLVDSIGGLDDAVRIARELAKIPERRKAVYREFPKPKFWDRMMEHMLSSNSSIKDSSITNMFFPASLLEDIRYRIANNGKAMPILPLDSGWQAK